jgi:hypothetical protein
MCQQHGQLRQHMGLSQTGGQQRTTRCHMCSSYQQCVSQELFWPLLCCHSGQAKPKPSEGFQLSFGQSNMYQRPSYVAHLPIAS